MRPAILATAVLLWAPTASLAEEDGPREASDSEYSVIMDMRSDPARCSLATARRVTIKELVAEPENLRGLCVAVTGYWQGRALFESDKEARKAGSNSEETFAAGRIGLYGYKVLNARRPSRIRFIAVGTAGHCATVAGGAMMVMGYCHYAPGPYVALSHLAPVR